MRVMGMQPAKINAFREYLRVVRALLHGEEVEYTVEGTTRTIRFLHRDLRFINLDDPIPLYIAANGPRALKVTGEYGDADHSPRLCCINQQGENTSPQNTPG